MGRHISNQENTSTINVSSLEQGLYLLLVEFGAGKQSQVVRWVKQ